MSQKDKIIVACDVQTIESAAQLADMLDKNIGALKVGLELVTSCGAPKVVEAISKKGRIFLDIKLKDIPNTVAGASRAATRLGVWMFNVHAMGGLEMMRAAKEASTDEAKKMGIDPPLVIAVTILTSLDAKALGQVGFKNVNDGADIERTVVRLALLAKEAGLDGVVASPREIAAIKRVCGAGFLVVTPGIRPKWAAKGDQKRITTPKDAVNLGADYLVIGRPITDPPKEVGGPADAVRKILEEM